jgi:formamidopyrimidine-DNA glycosylase
MPELPEVETIKNELLPHVINRCIAGVEIRRDSTVRGLTPAELIDRLTGRRIEKLERYGKYLLFALDNGDYLAMHMKLTGSLWIINDGAVEPEYVKAVLTLDSGEKIFLRDPRTFARIWLVNDICAITDKLGPEPLAEAFTPALLAARLAGKNTPIKTLLIDQAVIAGIGNMYADEILYDAKIDPRRAGSSLKRGEIRRIHQSTGTILRQGIASKGASVQDFYRPSGEEGREQFNFKVAHRRKANCPCGGPIERIVVRGRGTYYCPNCQK